MIYASEFFLVRLRNVEHFYIDGTFQCTPYDYN